MSFETSGYGQLGQLTRGQFEDVEYNRIGNMYSYLSEEVIYCGSRT